MSSSKSVKKESESKPLKIFRVIKNIICIVFAVLIALLLLFVFINKVSGSTPTLFGYSVLRVSSGSMEPTLMTGDVILDKTVDDVSELEVGDIITFNGSGSLDGLLVTHEVIVAPHENESGELVLQTKGVANETADDEIKATQVVSKFVTKLSFLVELYSFFLSPWGLVVFIGLLMLIFFDELLYLVRTITGSNRNNAEDINEIIERMQKENNEDSDDQSHSDEE